MPITPRFALTQDETHVIVEIIVPHVRVSVQSVEIVVVDECAFHFSSPPYLLVLTFPQESLINTEDDDNGATATFDPSRNGGTVTVTLQKHRTGVWKDLDMMGTLMTPKEPKHNPSGRRGNISIVSSSLSAPETEAHVNGDENDNLSCDDEDGSLQHALLPRYGFRNMFANVFTDLAREGLASEMLQLPWPDQTAASDRRQLRIQAEKKAFDPDRYLGDLDVQEDYIYRAAMSMTPHWVQEKKQQGGACRKGGEDADIENLAQQLSQLTTDDTDIKEENGNSTTFYFTPDEMTQLASIPYPILPSVISPEQQVSLLHGLLDILFAYVYDYLTTQGDCTVESSWTICTLSCTLSWLEYYHQDCDLRDVVRNSIRRVLIYPYLRNYDLAFTCWDHVLKVMQNGKPCILRCLLQTRSILDKSECHYLGNRLYIDPYLLWIQKLQDDECNAPLSMVASDLKSLLLQGSRELSKDSLGLDLVRLESMLLQQDHGDDKNENASTSEDDSENECSDEASSETGDSSLAGSDNPLHIEPSKNADNADGEEAQGCTKEQRHSTELLDVELSSTNGELESQTATSLSGLVTSTTSAGTSPEVAKKEMTSKKPLIEEI